MNKLLEYVKTLDKKVLIGVGVGLAVLVIIIIALLAGGNNEPSDGGSILTETEEFYTESSVATEIFETEFVTELETEMVTEVVTQ